MFELHRNKKIIIAAGLIAFYALAGFFLLPALLEPRIREAISERTNCPVRLGELRVNPFALSTTVRDFTLMDRDSVPMVTFKELYINFEAVSLFRQAWVFSEIHLSRPDIFVGVRADGTTNLADAMPPDSVSVESAEPPDTLVPPPVAVAVQDLRIDSGRVVFEDRARPTVYRSDFDSLELSLKDFTTLPNEDGEYRFEATNGRDAVVRWQGRVSVVPLRSSGSLELLNLRVERFWDYIRHSVNYEIPTGFADIRADYTLDMSGGQTLFALRNGAVTTRDILIDNTIDTVEAVSLPRLSITGIRMDYPAKEVEVGLITANNTTLLNVAHADSTMTLKTMWLPKLAAGEAPPPDAPMTWKVLLKKIELTALTFRQEDRSTTPPAILELSPADATLENFRLDRPEPAGFSLRTAVNGGGTAVATGNVTIDIDRVRVDAEAEADVANVALAPFQPYVNEYARMEMKSGTAGYRGTVKFSLRDGKRTIDYDGDVRFDGVVVSDLVLQEDFLRLGRLDLRKLSFHQSERSLSIAEIVATKPYLRFIIGPDRVSNIANMMGADSTTADSTSEATGDVTGDVTTGGPSTRSRITQLRVVDGSMNFSDHSLTPNFNVGIHEMGGTIKGLSSEQVSRADVDLAGKVDKYAPALIRGQINPLSEEAFTDITLSFHGIELATFNPYSNRFAGYKIDRGKLNVDLHYKLNKTYIEGENKIVLDQLTLGEKVESPDATSLPVKLAIALLKDSRGVIDLDIPISGDVDDPEFSVMPIVLKALLNLVVKAVTAPFKLLGALFGGGDEDLSYVEFSPGADSISANEEEKLASLARALKERPELALDVRGIVVDTIDREALAGNAVFSALRPRTPVTRDVATLTPEQRAGIRAQYAATFGEDPEILVPRPSEEEGKDISDEEYDLLVTKAALIRSIRSYTVPDESLIALARARADAVKSYLVLGNGIGEERVFLADVNVKAEPKDGAVQMELLLQAR